MERTITDLCYDYFDAAEKMDALIKKCTLEIKEARKRHQLNRYYELKHKRMVFYSQKRELMETAYRLQNYYRKEDVKFEHDCA